MKELHGISINQSPFSLEEEIGILLYEEYPSTIVYADIDGQPIIKEWLDCDDVTDRFFTFKTTRGDLASYIFERTSHFDLFFTCENGLGMLTDEADQNVISISLIAPGKLPSEYLPSLESVFIPRNGVDTDVIVQHFSLNAFHQQENEGSDETLTDLAQTYNSDIFNLHMLSGNRVGRGRIDTDTLGRSLIAFNDLYREIALDRLYGQPRSDNKDKARRIPIGILDTEIVLDKAASFSVYIKPGKARDFQVQAREDDSIPNKLYSLIEASKNDNSLKAIVGGYSNEVFKALREFLVIIKVRDIKVDINWTDKNNDKFLSASFNKEKAVNALGRIDHFGEDTTRDFDLTGKFISINIRTKHFKFISEGRQEYQGHFSDQLAGGRDRLNFETIYNVTIEQSISNTVGRKAGKPRNEMVSCLPAIN